MTCGLTINSRLSKEDVHNRDVLLIGVVIGHVLKIIDPFTYVVNESNLGKRSYELPVSHKVW